METIREWIDRKFTKEDASFHSGATIGQLNKWLPMLKLSLDVKRVPGRGRPRRLYRLGDVIMLAVLRHLVSESGIDRAVAVKMIEAMHGEILERAFLWLQERNLEIKFMEIAAVREFMRTLEKPMPKGTDKALAKRARKAALSVRDQLYDRIAELMPPESAWLVFMRGIRGTYSFNVHFETEVPGDQYFNFHQLLKFAAWSVNFFAVNFGEIAGEVCRSIFSEHISYSAFLDQLVGDELLDTLLKAGGIDEQAR